MIGNVEEEPRFVNEKQYFLYFQIQQDDDHACQKGEETGFIVEYKSRKETIKRIKCKLFCIIFYTLLLSLLIFRKNLTNMSLGIYMHAKDREVLMDVF